jgi:DNA-binding NarL/FixJ family response regulator
MKIIICDDQAIVRDGLELLLSLEKDITISAVCEDGAQVMEVLETKQPDIILMDLKMPGINGIEATRRIHNLYPSIKVLVLTTFDDDEWVLDAIRAGAAGYLLKDTPRAKLVEAIHGTFEGKTFLDPKIAGKIMDQATSKQSRPTSIMSSKLSMREIDVLRLVAHGLSNIEIAQQLSLSEGTVRNNVSAILNKLELPDRTQAAILAIRHGLD